MSKKYGYNRILAPLPDGGFGITALIEGDCSKERINAMTKYALAIDFYRGAEIFQKKLLNYSIENIHSSKDDSYWVINSFALQWAHCLELMFKSFLALKGYPDKKLKTKYGHNLEKLLDSVKKENGDFLDKDDENVIFFANKYYGSMDARYKNTISINSPESLMQVLKKFGREFEKILY